MMASSNDPGDGPPAGLALTRMTQQREMTVTEEDWTGVSNSKKRRMLQNRLNQRAYRRRRRQQKEELEKSDPRTGRRCHLWQTGVQEEIQRFAEDARQDYLSNSWRPSTLHILIQINVFQALQYNATLLGWEIMSSCDPETISPFSLHGPSPNLPESTPQSLRPTSLQVSILHHPWIDLWPIPKLRDNMILAQDVIDEEDLCVDIADVRVDLEEKASLVLWGDPSDPYAWEASVPFLKKWGFLLKGCHEILAATNFWRQRSGRRPLDFPTRT